MLQHRATPPTASPPPLGSHQGAEQLEGSDRSSWLADTGERRSERDQYSHNAYAHTEGKLCQAFRRNAGLQAATSHAVVKTAEGVKAISLCQEEQTHALVLAAH